MGYPRYTTGKAICLRVCKVSPMVVLNSPDKKVLKVLISELNPPLCKVIKEMAQGGSFGSVPIAFANPQSLSRTCPPVLCDCKPCPEPDALKKFLKYLVLGLKISFLGGCLYEMWDLGILGSTYDTWYFKECIKNSYYKCQNIEFVYKDKCNPKPEPENDPVCEKVDLIWNKIVFNFIEGMKSFYYCMEDCGTYLMNYENCKKVDDPKAPKPLAEGEEPPPPIDLKKVWASIFSEMDPINISCPESEDYFAMLVMGSDDE